MTRERSWRISSSPCVITVWMQIRYVRMSIDHVEEKKNSWISIVLLGIAWKRR
ncbi:hypothetical protein DM02DRAFT_168230 [Periconia macrospinosa]|uniref:Uncharacterized protein n=1 Tax=Periconia macrospinosa TaxID=97972 RepID=A0A2V1E247_9PLEO|nr:hypothetical protein DM02DRAFT_168230 [Periconia macrospinosa]